MPIEPGELIVSAGVGLGLAAACGFRIFLPFLALGLAARAGWVPLADGFAWVASPAAVAAFALATLLEIGAWYLPWLDNLLDTAATPAAVAAGALASAAVLTDLPPLVQWSVALIGGGAAAGLVQGATALLRLGSSTTTGGLGNPLLATGEWLAAAATAALALLAPLLALALLAVLLVAALRLLRRRRAVS